jgi:mannan endo-1,4-beta-mannosidase
MSMTRGGRAVRRRVETAIALFATLGFVFATASTATPAVSSAHRVRIGVAVQSNGRDLREVHAFEVDAGKQVSIVQYARNFADEVFEPALARRIAATYGTPMVLLMPKDPRLPKTNQPKYRLINIINGHFDSYLHTFARAVKSARVKVLIRFADEPNGNWDPWSESKNGNKPGEYVRAWRHVHDLFVRDGATNAKWVWSPNVSEPGFTPMRELYPGPAYVDWVALDGYNWGLSKASKDWRSPAKIFNVSISKITAIAPGKPLMLSEVASAGNGPDKSEWIRSFFQWLPTRPEIRAFVWENIVQDDRSWPIESSPAAAAAFRAGVADPRYH